MTKRSFNAQPDEVRSADESPVGRKALGSTDLKRLHRSWRRRATRRVGLLLDGVQSPFNTGAIVRTAAALRVDHVWLANGATALDDARAGKTSLGCQRYLTWTEVDDPAVVTDAGYSLVGLELAEGADPMHEVDLTGDVCLAVGHEDRGLSKAVLAACDRLVYLPQLGRVGSLNVATATAIGLYELRRREWTGEGLPASDPQRVDLDP